MRPPLALIPPLVAFGAGVAAGAYVGRATLEAKWRDGIQPITEEEEARSAIPGADPTPKVGTKVVRDMPFARARLALGEWTSDDPVVVTRTEFVKADATTELRLDLQNRAPCEVTGVEGVAYGYDADGQPTAVNEAGEAWVAFSASDLKMPSGAGGAVEQAVHFALHATFALAQVELYECSDGTVWKPFR